MRNCLSERELRRVVRVARVSFFCLVDPRPIHLPMLAEARDKSVAIVGAIVVLLALLVGLVLGPSDKGD